MAVTRIIKRTDDLGGAGEASEVKFSINGQTYSIDLNKRNRETFERRLQAYVEHARTENVTPPDVHTLEIREWARENGFEVSNYGRLSQEVLDAFVASK